jgi:DNA-binding response OmpR family regulator
MQRIGSVLIVDSEPAIVDLLVELLTDAGYSVLTASNCASACHLIINYAPALLLLDMRMPGMKGAELIAQLRGVGVATMPIVLMTTEPHAVASLLVPGAIMCVAKPFDIDDVLGCVSDHVRPHGAGAISLGTWHSCRSDDLKDCSETASSL